jgi:hypothetical protein
MKKAERERENERFREKTSIAGVRRDVNKGVYV